MQSYLKMSKVVTRMGDNGMTLLLDGTSVAKSNELIEICGSIDELSAFIGLIISASSPLCNYRTYLIKVENILIRIGSFYAAKLLPENDLPEACVDEIENLINVIEKQIPQINSFVDFHENIVSSYTNISRVICRRLERVIVKVEKRSMSLKYINRLSDYLFLLACLINNTIE